MKVGFIGLGRMGSSIAGRIPVGGHDLVVYNRTPGKADELVARGAHVALGGGGVRGPRRRADYARGRRGARGGDARAGRDQGFARQRRDPPPMGTHGVAAIEELAAAHEEAGQILVAAHVLGRPDMAASGQLGIVAAGPADAVARCAPLY